MTTIKHFNAEENTLILVKEVKGEKVKTNEYKLPDFIEGTMMKLAIDLGKDVQENNFMITGELFEKLAKFIVDLYGEQFTSEKLIKGIDSRKIVETFIEVLFKMLQGETQEE